MRFYLKEIHRLSHEECQCHPELFSCTIVGAYSNAQNFEVGQVHDMQQELAALTGTTIFVISGLDGLFTNLRSLKDTLQLITANASELFVYETSTNHGSFKVAEIVDAIVEVEARRPIAAAMGQLLEALTHVAIAKDLMSKGRQRLLHFTVGSRNSGEIDLNPTGANRGLRYQIQGTWRHAGANDGLRHLNSASDFYKRKTTCDKDDDGLVKCPVPDCSQSSKNLDEIFGHVANKIRSRRQRCPFGSLSGGSIGARPSDRQIPLFLRPCLKLYSNPEPMQPSRRGAKQIMMKKHAARHCSVEVSCDVDDCPRSFGTRTEMLKHLMTSHGYNAECEECGLVLSAANMPRHKRLHQQSNQIGIYADLLGVQRVVVPRVEQQYANDTDAQASLPVILKSHSRS